MRVITLLGRKSFATILVALFMASGLAGCAKQDPEALLASAKRYAEKRDFTAAIIEIKNLLQKRPDDAEARFLFGSWLVEGGDYGSAETELRRALQYKHPEEAVVPILARAMLDGGQAKKLVDEFGASTLRAPAAQAALQTQVGMAHLQLTAVPAAREAFAAARRAVADYPGAMIGESRILAALGDVAAAERTVDLVLARDPQLLEAQYFKGELAMAQRKFADAATMFAKVVEKTPRAAGAWFMLVLALTDDGKIDDAKKRLEGFKKAVPRDMRQSYLTAWLALRDRNLTAARDAGLQVLKLAPDHPPTLLLMGLVEYETNNFSLAQDYLKRSLDRAPRNGVATQALVATYLRLGQPQRAEERLLPLLKGAGEDPRILSLAGEVALANGRIPESRRFFERSVAADTKNPKTQLRLGEIYLAAREDDRAAESLKAAAALDPSSDAPELVIIANSLGRRDFDKALVAIDVLDKKRANNPVASNLRGSAYLAKGDVPKARASFEQALAIDQAFFPAAMNLAGLDMRDGKRDAARSRFEKVLAKDAKNPRASIALADVLIADGRPAKEIVDVLDRAVRENRVSPEIHVALISYHLRTRDPRLAVAAGGNAVAALPDNAAVHELLGIAQQAGGEFNQAIQTFQKFAGLSPASGLPWIRIAGVYGAQKQYDPAITALRKGLEVEPGNLDAVRELAAVFTLKGLPDQAVREARALQERQPKQVVGYALEGDLLGAQKRFAEAERAYAKGLVAVPVPGLLIRRVVALDRSGNRAGGDAAAASWSKEHPKDIVVRSFMAERALQAKDFKGAVGHYRIAVDLQPENPLLLNNLAWASGRAGDPRALEYAERALALAPESAPVLDTYGMLLVERGQAAKGLDLLQRASSLAPTNADIRLNVARGMAAAGQKADARREIEAALKLPDAERIKAESEALLKTL